MAVTYTPVTDWVIAAQATNTGSNKWLGAAARIVKASDSTETSFHLYGEYSFYQWYLVSGSGTNNVYKYLSGVDSSRFATSTPHEAIALGTSLTYPCLRGTVRRVELGTYGNNVSVTTPAFDCGWNGTTYSNAAIASYTTPAAPITNQNVNKVVIEDETLIDISSDTVTEAVLLSGYTAHDRNGASIVGEYVDQDTTYSAGTGLSLSGTTFNHSNSVTAGTIGQSSATSGSAIAVPYATYDAQGHITGSGTHEHRLSVAANGNAGTAGRWYKVCTLPANNSSNMATLIIEGRFGDYLVTRSSYGRFLVGNRNGLSITCDFLTPNNSVASTEGLPAAFSKVNVVCYTQTDGTVNVYLKCVNYYFFDFVMRLCNNGTDAAYYGTYTYDGTYVTTEPSGTLDAQASTASGGVFNAPRIRSSLVQSNTSYYGTCSTAAGTAAKVVSCSSFVLVTGASIAVAASTANTVAGAITLNVNSTGAKTVYTKNAATSASNTLPWSANTHLLFVYDGSHWRFVGTDAVSSGSGSGGSGVTCTESSWGVSYATALTWPSSGVGGREWKYSDGRLVRWVWDWFAVSGQVMGNKTISMANAVTAFTDTPICTFSVRTNGTVAVQAPVNSWSNTSVQFYCYANGSTGSSLKALICQRMEGHWK